MFSIFDRATHLGVVVRRRELLFLTSIRDIASDVQLGTEGWMFEHDGRVSKLLDQAVFALNSRIGDLSNLVRVEAIPTFSSPSKDKWDDRRRIDEVDESIADIAVVGEVNAKIHEVISPKAGLIDNLLQHGLINTVWNVAQHDRPC